MKNQQGYILILAIVFLAIMLSLSGVIVSYSYMHVKGVRQTTANEQSLELAQAGIDKAIYELNQDTSFSGESNVALGSGVFTTVVATSGSNKTITSTGYIPNSANPTARTTVKVTASIDSSVVSFRYGVQAGTGGFALTGGSTINGNVYSNADIDATTGVHITGSAVAANPASLSTDQTNNSPTPIGTCSSSTCVTFANASGTQDFAQSFKISDDIPLNKIEFYIKKVSTPSDATIKIVNDNSGSPGTDLLMSATLSASLVTTSFGWVSVNMPTTPILDPSETYWMVIDAGSNASRYYIIGANTNGYANGVAKIGQYGSSWSNTTPSGLDGYFQLYLGGGNSLIGGNSYVTGVYVGTAITDDTWAHTVMGATATGTIYCQTSSFTNKACNTSRADPTAQPMPLSDNNIQDWKDDADTGGTITGDYNVGYAGATIGPKHITGNVLVNGGGTLTVSGTLWIEGNLTLTGGGKIKLAASFGSDSGAIVTDGHVSLGGGGTFAGSGTAGSYPFLITTSACPVAPGCSGNNAVEMSGGTGAVAVIAQNGTIHIAGGSSLKAVTGKQISMDGGASLVYDSGLVSANFSSGPGGSWTYLPGSYVIVD